MAALRDWLLGRFSFWRTDGILLVEQPDPHCARGDSDKDLSAVASMLDEMVGLRDSGIDNFTSAVWTDVISGKQNGV
jgi:hypothetical protein